MQPTATDIGSLNLLVYERFSVNGMRSQHIGTNTGYGNEGDFIANPRNMTMQAPVWDAAQNYSYVCLTAACDVAQFVVRAIDMPTWAPEMSMHGDRMTVIELLEVIRLCRSRMTVPEHMKSLTDTEIDRSWANEDYQDAPNLQYQMTMAQNAGDGRKYRRLAPLLAAVGSPCLVGERY